MEILRYPDPRLSQPCVPVTVFDAALAAFAEDLLHIMRAAPGVGITAAHVGHFFRLFVLELPGWEKPLFYVNPVVQEAGSDTILHTEGSVSMPGATEEVERPRRVRFSYQDLQGHHHEDVADDFHAVCVQHEIDQLDGIFWLRRLSRLKRDRLVRRWEKDRLRAGTT
jgi:peptide deformylase